MVRLDCNPDKPKDLVELFDAVEHDDTPTQALLDLALGCIGNSMVPNGYNIAFYCLLQAAKRGHVDAQRRVGIMLYNNSLSAATHPAMHLQHQCQHLGAAFWLREAATQGNLESMYILGSMYAKGTGGAQLDPFQARTWLTLAAEQGHCPSQHMLSQMYESHAFSGEGGDESGGWAGTTPAYTQDRHCHHDNNDHSNNHNINHSNNDDSDEIQAVYWLRQAANQGFHESMYRLGERHWMGHGVEQDVRQAIDLYQTPARAGYAGAQYRLAWAYSVGQGVEACDETARKWCTESAKRNHLPCGLALGLFFELGLGGAQNNMQALAWYHRTSARGVDDAQRHFDCLVARHRFLQQEAVSGGEGNGDGEGGNGPRTDENTTAWYRRAFEQGFVAAACCLGVIYEKGMFGVSIDIDQAMDWYNKGVERGCRHLESRMKYLRGRGTR
ncbi:hypothetical protein DFQ26_008647 [Actinomortierella ambigua]|nr:hypothetical protein DFQ26_008647 [Actinomortierella ambigua]